MPSFSKQDTSYSKRIYITSPGPDPDSRDYSNFKYITEPKASSFQDRFHTYGSEEISYVEDEDMYNITENFSLLILVAVSTAEK